MEKEYTGKEVVEMFGKHNYEIFDLMKEGLQAFTWHGKRIIDESELYEHSFSGVRLYNEEDQDFGLEPQKRDTEFLNSLGDIENCIFISFDIPDDEEKARKKIEKALDYRFRESDIDKLADGRIEKTLPKLRDGVQGEYIFVREGPAWKIVYKGRTLSGLTGKGFEIIHYLVCNKGKVFHTDELADFSGEISEAKKGFAGIESASFEAGNLDGNIGRKENIVGDKVDLKTIRECKKHIKDLKQDLQEAKKNNDQGRILERNKEIEKIQKYLIKATNKTGKSRKFIDESEKNKNRITKRIERELKKIKKHDEAIWSHFSKALGPINTLIQS